MKSQQIIEGRIYQYDSTGIDTYYSKYSFKVHISFPCVGKARYYKDAPSFISRLDKQLYNSWAGISSTLRETIKRGGGSLDDLLQFISWKNTLSNRNIKYNLVAGAKLVTTRNNLLIYFNDPEIVQNFIDNVGGKFTINAYYRTKKQDYLKDVVYQKNPTHKWRIYLTSQHLSIDEALDFSEFLIGNNVKACPSLLKNLNRTYARTFKPMIYIFSGNFIDINDERLTTILGLQFPAFIKKVCNIERM
jgi:hypothetical protein